MNYSFSRNLSHLSAIQSGISFEMGFAMFLVIVLAKVLFVLFVSVEDLGPNFQALFFELLKFVWQIIVNYIHIVFKFAKNCSFQPWSREYLKSNLEKK